MLSKATFDLDHDNNPVVKLQIISTTDDVRDKIAKRFIEALGHESTWCQILSNGTNEYTIWPIAPSELREQAQYMIRLADKLDKHNSIDESVMPQ